MKTEPTENETKHTPGPWLIPESSKDFVYALGVGDTNIFSLQIQRSGPEKCTQQEVEANARLISAAPDLLAALEASVATMSKVQVGIAVGLGKYSPDIVAALAQARAAIARAKGAK